MTLLLKIKANAVLLLWVSDLEGHLHPRHMLPPPSSTEALLCFWERNVNNSVVMGTALALGCKTGTVMMPSSFTSVWWAETIVWSKCQHLCLQVPQSPCSFSLHTSSRHPLPMNPTLVHTHRDSILLLSPLFIFMAMGTQCESLRTPSYGLQSWLSSETQDSQPKRQVFQLRYHLPEASTGLKDTWLLATPDNRYDESNVEWWICHVPPPGHWTFIHVLNCCTVDSVKKITWQFRYIYR